MKLPVYEFSLHFRKFRFRFCDNADDIILNACTHKKATVLANLQSVNIKYAISMVCIHPFSTGFNLIETPLIG